jgi:hypothetical protein
MSLSDKLAQTSIQAKVVLCKVGALVEGTILPAKDKEYLLNALNTPEGSLNRLTNADIGRVLREEGFDISNSSVDRHRRSECSCNRKAAK